MPKYLSRMLRSGARPFLSSGPRLIKPAAGTMYEGAGPVSIPGPLKAEVPAREERTGTAVETPSESNRVPATEHPGRSPQSVNTIQRKIDPHPPLSGKVNPVPEVIRNAGAETRTGVRGQTEQSKEESIVTLSDRTVKGSPHQELKEKSNPGDKKHTGAESGHVVVPQSDDRRNEQGDSFSGERLAEKRLSPVGTKTVRRGAFEIPRSMPGIRDKRTKEKRVPVFVDSEPANVSIGRQLENRHSAMNWEIRSAARKREEENLLKPDHEKAVVEPEAGPACEREAGRRAVIAQAGMGRRIPAGIEGQRTMTINRIDIQIIDRQSSQPVQKIEAPRQDKRSPEIYELLDRCHFGRSLLDF